MPGIKITPDQTVFFQWGFVSLNETIVFTWVVIAVVMLAVWLVTRRVRMGPPISRFQGIVETILGYIREQVGEITEQNPDRFLPFIATLFLFISVSNFLNIVPGYRAPTSSISTTIGLALVVFFAVPIFGITEQGLSGYLKRYIEPTPLMLPFNIVAQLSRTIALAVRLFGNIMSETLIVAILLSIVPFFAPVVLEGLGLLIGQIQAYIFAVLATVYIGAATRQENQPGPSSKFQEVRHG